MRLEALSFTYVDASGGPYTLDLTSGRIKSHEACGVWHFSGQAWKVFSNRDSYPKIQSVYELARSAGLPTPAFYFVLGTVACRQGRPREGFALVSTFVSGHVFTLDQKHNATGPFMNVMNFISDIQVLWKIEHGLGLAISIGLRDPQGFIDTTSSHPIMFIDLHTGSSASGSLTQMYNAVSMRRNDLQNN